MDGRRWQSPAAEAAAAEAAAEDAGVTGYGGAGGPSRRPPRRGLHRASPYGLGPRRWLPKLPVASRIFPTVSRDHTASDNNQMDQCESQEVTHESQSTETNANAVADAVPPPENNKVNMLLEGDYRNQNDGSGLAEIEKIIKQNHFSRDETEHLIEIMRSRTPDLCDEDQIAPRSFAKGFEATAFSDKLSTPAKPVDLRSSWGTGIFAPSNVHDAGSSPIELAKAYMEAQISASVHESQRRKFRALSHGVEVDNSSSKFFPKVATDSPVCWPGSVVRDYPNDLTPQSNKGRTLPPTSSRTPYTGSVFPRSIKHTGYRDTYNNSSGRAQLSTSFPVGSKAILEDKMASNCSVLALQPSTPSKGAYRDTVGATTPFFPRDGSASMKNLTLSLQGPHGKGTIESGSTVGRVSVVDSMSKRAAVSVHPKSSQTAHKILQHLERTIPSPTAKPLELRQTSAKRTAHSFVTNSQYKVPDSVTSNGHRQSIMNDSGSAHQKISDVNKAPPSSSNAEELTPNVQNGGSNSEVTQMLSSRHPLKSDSTSASTAEVVDKSKNNCFTFTFPVTVKSSSLPELPPTPTLASPPARSLPGDTEDIPKFTFGSSSSTNNLVFTFDSAGSSVDEDETVPTFKFGSDKKRELSFNIAGKDAVCF